MGDTKEQLFFRLQWDKSVGEGAVWKKEGLPHERITLPPGIFLSGGGGQMLGERKISNGVIEFSVKPQISEICCRL